MSKEYDSDLVLGWIDTQTEHSPPEHPEAPPLEIFPEFGEYGEVDESLADLWAWGMLQAEPREEGNTAFKLSEFACELFEKGLNDLYIQAKANDTVEVEAPSLEQMNQVRYLRGGENA